jgi:hypothetical protein
MIAKFDMDTVTPGLWRFDSRLPRLGQPFLCDA